MSITVMITYRVEGTSVIPDCHISNSRRVVDSPLESDLKIVVVRNEFLPSAITPHTPRQTHKEIIEQDVRLILGHSQNPLCKLFIHKQPLPPSHRVDSYDRMNSLQRISLIQWMSSFFLSDLVAICLRGVFEPFRLVVCRQPLEQRRDGRRETRVGFVG